LVALAAPFVDRFMDWGNGYMDKGDYEFIVALWWAWLVIWIFCIPVRALAITAERVAKKIQEYQKERKRQLPTNEFVGLTEPGFHRTGG
jgi:hypothetical protein